MTLARTGLTSEAATPWTPFPPLLSDRAFAFDVRIVGAGPAGIAMAREFVGTKTQVCFVESGHLAVSSSTQEPARGETDFAAVRRMAEAADAAVEHAV